MALADKTPAVYKITNLINGRVYIGSTKDMTKRFKQYIFAVKRVTEDPNIADRYNSIIADIAKYGWDNFEFKIVDNSIYMQDTDLRAVREVELIMKYRSILPEYGYNSTMGGESGATKHRKQVNRKPKALFLYDTKNDNISLYLKGTSTVHNDIKCRKDNIPDAIQRGKFVKGRYFIFYANSERRKLFADKIKFERDNYKTNGKNDESQNNYALYLNALDAVDKYAEEIGF